MSARTARVLAAALGLLMLAAAGPAPADETRLQEYFRLRKEGAAAAQAGDLAAAKQAFETARSLYPDVPGGHIRIARVQAASGDLNDALDSLGRYAATGLTYDVAADPALKPLTALPGWRDVALMLNDNARPIGKTTEVATVTGEPGWIGEGVVADGKGGFLLSTVSGRTIVRLGPAGAKPYLRSETIGGAIFGLAVDKRRGRLWAAEAWGDGVPEQSGIPGTGLLEISLADGRVLHSWHLPSDGKPHQFGDVMIGPDGTVYASDSVGGDVYRLKPDGEGPIERVSLPGQMASPQGMVMCPGGKAMIVADYATGLHRLDLKTGETSPLDGLMAGLAGTDGLVAAPDYRFTTRAASPGAFAVVATQNGVAPQRVMLLRIKRDCTELEGAEPVVANLPGVDDVTLAATEGRTVVFVGHSRWEARGRDLKLARPEPGPIRVFSAPLPDPLW